MIILLLISEIQEINVLIFFEARAVILDSWGPLGRFLEPLSDFLKNREFTDSPKGVDFGTFCVFFVWSFFLECSRFWIFVFLDAQRLHFGFHFDSFLGALGVLRNSYKCVTIVNFRGLTPLGCDLFPDLDRECVLTLICSDGLDF